MRTASKVARAFGCEAFEGQRSCVCMCVCAQGGLRACARVCRGVCACVHRGAHACVCTGVSCTWVCVRTCVQGCVCVHVCAQGCVYACPLSQTLAGCGTDFHQGAVQPRRECSVHRTRCPPLTPGSGQGLAPPATGPWVHSSHTGSPRRPCPSFSQL